ncbi:MAG: VWA domain-containing protein [Proteobacteria bacterium]|nr:VWA domain-containing protein [Pseudomonadota bacterium]
MNTARVSARMTPARKTSAILLLAGLVAGSATLFTHTGSAFDPIADTPNTARDPSGLQISARMQSSHLLRGTGDSYMAVTIEAPTTEKPHNRPPVNVAIVIDRSGSMSGQKLRHAKQAARQLVNQLHPSDRVAIIAYGSDVDVAFRSARATQTTKSAAYRAIDSIYDDGGTNLSGGLLAGHDQIARNPEPASVERIVLISDGHANAGIVGFDQLALLASQTAERGISITTVGVGLDFDERMMTQIAVSGRGHYYFAESSLMLADLFRQELDKLSATVATHVQLTLSPKPGVQIADAFGYPMEHTGSQVLVPVADLHAGETRKVVLHLRVDAKTPGEMAIADIAISFRPTESLAQRTLHIAARTAVTDNRDTVLAGRDREAIRHIERARTAKAINLATERYEAGDSAGAMQVLRARRKEAQSIASSVNDAALGAELGKAADNADNAFQIAPAASKAGKRARKKTRAKAYRLMY